MFLSVCCIPGNRHLAIHDASGEVVHDASGDTFRH